MADLSEDSVEVKPPIIMKIDSPTDDNNVLTSQEETVNNTSEQSEAVKTPIKIKKNILSSSRLNNSTSSVTMRPSLLSSPKTNTGVVLRPSALSTPVENNKTVDKSKNSFTLCPSRLNPFAKVDNLELSTSNISNSNNTDNGDSLKFVPLAVTETTTTTTSSASVSVASASNFVFGQNLHERVVAENEENVSSFTASGSNNSNGTNELLFTNAVKSVSTENKEVKSLSESAREYEESRANKRKYEAVTVVTGEEDEQNVLQINCKLFAFEAISGNWHERGRGTLRLNDKDATQTQSRLVFRTAGSLRVILNTKIWAEMTVDRASVKSLRLTAMDATGQIKVFLIMASAEEVNQLQKLLDTRLAKLKETAGEPQNKKPALQTH